MYIYTCTDPVIPGAHHTRCSVSLHQCLPAARTVPHGHCRLVNLSWLCIRGPTAHPTSGMPFFLLCPRYGMFYTWRHSQRSDTLIRDHEITMVFSIKFIVHISLIVIIHEHTRTSTHTPMPSKPCTHMHRILPPIRLAQARRPRAIYASERGTRWFTFP